MHTNFSSDNTTTQDSTAGGETASQRGVRPASTLMVPLCTLEYGFPHSSDARVRRAGTRVDSRPRFFFKKNTVLEYLVS